MSIVSIAGEIDRCSKAKAALVEIERLHTAVETCAGCHLKECPGDCDWADGEAFYGDPRTVVVCGLCCWDSYENARSEECIESHDHDGGPLCSTTEIIARARDE